MTRFAPTPSGFLHLGNVFNLLWCYLISKSQGAGILLRIDDLDRSRFREEYLTDIFKTIDWLGITFETGPTGVDDFYKNWSQHTRSHLYDEKKQWLISNQMVFACECSRKSIGNDTNLYSGTCKNKKLDLYGKHTLRNFPNPKPIVVKELSVGEVLSLTTTKKELDYMIALFGKEGQPSYQLASLVDDVHFGITHIIRGTDLYQSSLMQLYLSQILLMSPFNEIIFMHHPLLLNSKGEKISKSTSSSSSRTPLHKLYSKKEVFSSFSRLYFDTDTYSIENLTDLFDSFESFRQTTKNREWI